MRNAMHILAFVGTRPEWIKLWPVVMELRATSWAKCSVAITNEQAELVSRMESDLPLSAQLIADKPNTEGSSFCDLLSYEFIVSAIKCSN